MANPNSACDLDESALSCALNESVCDLARGKDVFAIMPTGFGRSLIFQLFPRLAKAALTLENSTIIVVSPLISTMTYNARPSGTTEKAWIFGPSLDCEQYLIFLCKVTSRETQARERRSRDKRGRKHEKKK